jgi:hypothetical protein
VSSIQTAKQPQESPRSPAPERVRKTSKWQESLSWRVGFVLRATRKDTSRKRDDGYRGQPKNEISQTTATAMSTT